MLISVQVVFVPVRINFIHENLIIINAVENVVGLLVAGADADLVGSGHFY